jgi:hypothetical protein
MAIDQPTYLPPEQLAMGALAHYTKYLFECARVPGDLGIIGQDPNLVFFKSNRSHVDIFHIFVY